MLNRSNISLLAVLVIQLVLLAVSVISTAGNERRAIEPLLKGLDAVDVDSITIADDLENLLRFARREEGWVLPDADDFPVNSSKVDELLDKLAGLDSARLVATNPANFVRLEVANDDFQRKLTIVSADKSDELLLGGSGGANTVYARREGEDKVYLGAGLSSWEASTSVSSWIDTSYVNVPQDDVLRIEVKNSHGSFEFLREGEAWRYRGLPDGEEFEDTMMPGILRNASSISMVQPMGRTALEEYGLAEAAVTVEVVFRQVVDVEPSGDDEESDLDEAEPVLEYTEESYTLTLGAEQDSGNYAAKSSSEAYYVTVRRTVFDAFNGIRHEDMLRQIELEPEGELETDGG